MGNVGRFDAPRRTLSPVARLTALSSALPTGFLVTLDAFVRSHMASIAFGLVALALTFVASALGWWHYSRDETGHSRRLEKRIEQEFGARGYGGGRPSVTVNRKFGGRWVLNLYSPPPSALANGSTSFLMVRATNQALPRYLWTDRILVATVLVLGCAAAAFVFLAAFV
jgi:hypothetical protein